MVLFISKDKVFSACKEVVFEHPPVVLVAKLKIQLGNFLGLVDDLESPNPLLAIQRGLELVHEGVFRVLLGFYFVIVCSYF